MSFKTLTSGSLHLGVIRNRDVRFTGLCIVCHVGFGLHAPHIGAQFSTHLHHSTCRLWVSSAHIVGHGGIGLSTPLHHPMPGLGSSDVFEGDRAGFDSFDKWGVAVS
jgi:hypothetical protein